MHTRDIEGGLCSLNYSLSLPKVFSAKPSLSQILFVVVVVAFVVAFVVVALVVAADTVVVSLSQRQQLWQNNFLVFYDLLLMLFAVLTKLCKCEFCALNSEGVKKKEEKYYILSFDKNTFQNF